MLCEILAFNGRASQVTARAMIGRGFTTGNNLPKLHEEAFSGVQSSQHAGYIAFVTRDSRLGIVHALQPGAVNSELPTQSFPRTLQMIVSVLRGECALERCAR
eukprot:763612-Hanusia_phi.AAC.21